MASAFHLGVPGMRHSEGSIGRVFVIRFEDGDKLPDAIEEFARDKKVLRGLCVLVGGIDDGGRIVCGPSDPEASPIVPMIHTLVGVHEIAAVGTIFPDEEGRPRIHMHAALGREGTTRAGCIRTGIEVWKLGEAILLEITGNTAHRRRDPATGFEVMEP